MARIRFLDDGRLEIDNLIAERTLRGVPTGRRNWLFADLQVGGEAVRKGGHVTQKKRTPPGNPGSKHAHISPHSRLPIGKRGNVGDVVPRLA